MSTRAARKPPQPPALAVGDVVRTDYAESRYPAVRSLKQGMGTGARARISLLLPTALPPSVLIQYESADGKRKSAEIRLRQTEIGSVSPTQTRARAKGGRTGEGDAEPDAPTTPTPGTGAAAQTPSTPTDEFDEMRAEWPLARQGIVPPGETPEWPALPRPQDFEGGTAPVPWEHMLQARVFYEVGKRVSDRPELALYFAVGNGGKRPRSVGATMRREGVKPGVLDTLYPVWRLAPAGAAGGIAVAPDRNQPPVRLYLGMWIEMKAPGGSLSAEQKRWAEALEAQGYRVEVHRSWRGALAALLAYDALPVADSPA